MHIPQNIQKNIFSYLHQQFDYEKARVIEELVYKIEQLQNLILIWKICDFDSDESRVRFLVQKEVRCY